MALAGEEATSQEASYIDEFGSDDEIRLDLHGTGSKGFQTTSSRTPQGIVISGEASESDDDEVDSKLASQVPPSGSDFSLSEHWGRQTSDATDQSDSSKREEQLKHDTLLHKKLKERNQSLRKSLIEKACQPYQSASKEIHSISQQLIKSQVVVQEVTSTLRRLTNELFVLEDRIQSIKSGSFIPDMDISAVPPLETP